MRRREFLLGAFGFLLIFFYNLTAKKRRFASYRIEELAGVALPGVNDNLTSAIN